jgi:predicted RNase H-like HicB family nuclease
VENQYTGVFEQVDGWWIGYVEEFPGCNVQERTLEDARESLKEAVQLVTSANRDLARREAAGHDVVREALAVSVE